MKRLLLYSRPGCDRCEDLEDALHASCGGRFQLDWKDVDRDPLSRQIWGGQIPVLLGEQGEVLCRGSFDPQAVEAYLG